MLSNYFKILLNRFNHQKNYLDKPANEATVSDTEDATTEDTESGDEEMMTPEPKVSPGKTSPPKGQYPGIKSTFRLNFRIPKLVSEK